jgi:hypothetical protein
MDSMMRSAPTVVRLNWQNSATLQQKTSMGGQTVILGGDAFVKMGMSSTSILISSFLTGSGGLLRFPDLLRSRELVRFPDFTFFRSKSTPRTEYWTAD